MPGYDDLMSGPGVPTLAQTLAPLSTGPVDVNAAQTLLADQQSAAARQAAAAAAPFHATPASAVPAAPLVTMPAAAPAAPGSSADVRNAAYDHTFGPVASSMTAPTTGADAQIMSQTPYVDPIKARIGQTYGVTGITNSSGTSKTQLSPEAKAAAARAEGLSGNQQEAIRAQGEVIRANAAEEYAQRNAVADQLTRDAATDLEKQTKIQRQVDDAMAYQQKVSDELQKASKDVDPNRLMKGGRGILAAVAAGLGAFGASMNGGPNHAQAIIDAAINRDWQSQKDAVDNKKLQLDLSGKMVQQLRAKLSDEQSVQLAHGAAMRDAWAQKFQAFGALHKGTELGAQMNTLAANIAADAARWHAQLLGQEQTTRSQSTGVTTGPTTKVESVLAHDAEVAKQKDVIETAANRKPTGDDVTAANKVITETNQALGTLDALNEFRKSLKGSTLPGFDKGVGNAAAIRDQWKAIASNAQLRKESGGAITGDEIDNMGRMISAGKYTLAAEAMDKAVGRYQAWLSRDRMRAIKSVKPALLDETLSRLRNSNDPELWKKVETGNWEDDGSALEAAGGTVRK